MFRKLLDLFLSYNVSNFNDEIFDMTESIENTDQVLNNNNHYHKALTSYIAGDCYYNGKLSHNLQLTDEEQIAADNLDALVLQTKPLSKPINLFHGFEAGLRYGDDKWRIGDQISFPFHLSKTPAYWVAQRFTNHFSWYMESLQRDLVDYRPACYNIGYYEAAKTLFFRKYLFCIYEEADKWQHVSSDMRCPRDMLNRADASTKVSLMLNEEFEYLSHRGEKFILVDVIYKIKFTLPFVRKFYVVRRI